MLAPIAKITLDRPRNLMWDMNSMIEFERVTGRNILAGMDFGNLTLIDLRALLWSMLIAEDPSLTLTDVGAMLHMGNIRELTAEIYAAFAANSPEPKAGADPNVASLPNPGLGMTSTDSAGTL